MIAVAGLLALSGGAMGGWYFYTHRRAARPDLIVHPVERKKMQITIVDRGSLESAENNEIVCQVKARAQGAAATNIRWVIDNGSIVRKGDKLVELDDSALQDQLIAQQILMETALGAWEQAEQTYVIEVSTAEGAIKTAEVALEVAKITLQEYLEGQFEQLRVDLENKLTMANSDLAMWEERAGWSERMSRPGRQYVTVAQAEADNARRLSAKLTLKNLETQYKALTDLTKAKMVTQYRGDVEEKVRGLERAKLQADATRIKNDVARRTTKLTYEKELSKLRDIKEEIEKCTLRAPKDGMVVYWIEERSRWGGGKQRFIAQGEAVDEGQKLMTIPNLERMVVNSRVHEAMAPRVRGDARRETGFTSVAEYALYLQPDLLTTLSTMATFRNDLSTPFALAHRKQERELVSRGQKARVRVSAFPDHSLRAHVREIAQVASANDLFASDVKVYQTYVAVDESMPGLKPGMDAEVTIEVESQPEPVLQVPVQGILGSVDMGHKRKVFVMTPEGPQMRDITVGMSNEKMVEVKEGLEEGDQVVLNPAVLLTEQERVEYGALPSRGAGGRDGKGGPEGAGKGKRGKDKGGMPGAGPEGAMPGGGKQGGGKQGGGKQGGWQGGRPQGGPAAGGGGGS